MIIDVEKMIVEAPVEKVSESLRLVQKVLWLYQTGRWIDVLVLQQLCGKLQSMVLALPGVRVFTRALYVLIARSLDENRTPRFKIQLEEYPESIDELHFWRDRLCSKYNGLPIHVRDASIKMWADAGDIGWGGEVMGETYHGELELDDIHRSSTRRELKALMEVGKAALTHIQGQRVHIHMDSAPAICNLLKGGGPKPDLVEVIKEWFHFCETNNIQPTYEWIPREENAVADRYSKLAAVQYSLCENVEKYIRQQLLIHCSDIPRVSTIPIFIPNFNVIPLRIESIVMNMSEAILVTPQWIGQSWWPTMLRHRVYSIYLGSIDKTLKPVQTEHWPRSWKMEAHWLKGRRKMAIKH